jgi:hypothetical protein
VAKIHEEVIVIKLSTLVKDTAKDPKLATAELLEALASVSEELAGAGVVVEVEPA